MEAGAAAPALEAPYQPPSTGLAFTAFPSVRLFDGRGANRPWLCEIPEPISRVAWQTPVWVHPDTARANGFDQADVVRVTTRAGSLEAPAYVTEVVRPGLLVMGIGQGHTAYGRYAQPADAKPGAEFSPTDLWTCLFCAMCRRRGPTPLPFCPPLLIPAAAGRALPRSTCASSGPAVR